LRLLIGSFRSREKEKQNKEKEGGNVYIYRERETREMKERRERDETRERDKGGKRDRRKDRKNNEIKNEWKNERESEKWGRTKREREKRGKEKRIGRNLPWLLMALTNSNPNELQPFNPIFHPFCFEIQEEHLTLWMNTQHSIAHHRIKTETSDTRIY